MEFLLIIVIIGIRLQAQLPVTSHSLSGHIAFHEGIIRYKVINMLALIQLRVHNCIDKQLHVLLHLLLSLILLLTLQPLGL